MGWNDEEWMKIYNKAMEEANGDESRIVWLKTGGYMIMPSDKMIKGFQKLMNADQKRWY